MSDIATVPELLRHQASRIPDEPFVRWRGRSVSYGEFHARTDALASGLADLGVRPGDIVSVMLPNCLEFLEAWWAILKAGAVFGPINPAFTAREAAYVLGHSQARGIVIESQLVTAMQDAVAKVPEVTDVIVVPRDLQTLTAHDSQEPQAFVDDNDALSYLYTSGTTSFPKGVVGSHKAIYLESMSGALDSGWRFDDRFAAMMPMFHTAQLNAFCTPAVMVGATIYVMRGFDPAALLNLVQDEQITQIFGLPMMYRAMLDHPAFAEYDLSSLRRAVYAMAPMPDDLIRRSLTGFGCDFALLFGQTEMSPCTTLFRPEHQLSHTGAVGTPLIGVQVAIMGPDGALLPPGEAGEIVYRGPSTMSGYLHNEEATDQAFAHGWFHSGDVGYFGDDGVLWFTDRHKDVIKTGGENVASIEVEKAIYAADPRVAETVVVGLPHQRWSEAITAFIVPKPGETIDADELIAALKARLDGFKVPKAVILVGELPKTSTGKIQKNVVRSEHSKYYEEG